MTAEQIQLVKKSWKTFRGISPATVGDLFYSKLFSDNPSWRKVFPKDMQQEYQKLIDLLNTVVMRLDKRDELKENITAIALRHEHFGLRPAQYKLAGAALVWTLQKGLADDWNEEVKNAWVACYAILVDMLLKSGSLAEKTC